MSAFAQTEKKQLRNINDTENLLKVALFVANQALLTLLSPKVKYSSSGVTGRKIYTSPGVTVQRPVLSKAALIILSVLLGLQLLGTTSTASQPGPTNWMPWPWLASEQAWITEVCYQPSVQ
jgi:hypothetical protein